MRLLFAFVVLTSVQLGCDNRAQPVATVALAVGIEDDGVTFGVPVGGLIQLTLPAGQDWQLDQTDRDFEIVDQSAGPNAAHRWLLRLTGVGDVQLRAVGAPTCSPQSSTCPAVRRFHATVSVR